MEMPRRNLAITAGRTILMNENTTPDEKISLSRLLAPCLQELLDFGSLIISLAVNPVKPYEFFLAVTGERTLGNAKQ